MKLDFKTLLNKYSIPLAALVIFTLVGLIVMWYRDIRYFYLFAGMGLMEFSSRVIVIHYPKTKQFFRLSVQFIIGGFLLFWLSIFIGVNFQFPEVFFDLSSGVVTGALIQTLVARVALPFIFGNAFCSRACWTGFFFEMTNSKKNISKPPKQRIEWLAWSYLVALIVVPFAIAGFHNPAEDEGLRRMWIVGENLFIVSVGFALTFISGSRSYCRMLCPFITISGLFSKYALFKITPVEGDSCTSCNKCTTACPMLIDVKELVAEKKKGSHKLCIVCERCVDSCPEDVLKYTYKKAK
jgi:polyferredoxin